MRGAATTNKQDAFDELKERIIIYTSRMRQTGHHGRKVSQESTGHVAETPGTTLIIENGSTWQVGIRHEPSQNAHIQRALIRLVCYTISVIFNCIVRAGQRCLDLSYSRKRAAHPVGRAAWTSPLPVPHVIQDCTRQHDQTHQPSSARIHSARERWNAHESSSHEVRSATVLVWITIRHPNHLGILIEQPTRMSWRSPSPHHQHGDYPILSHDELPESSTAV